MRRLSLSLLLCTSLLAARAARAEAKFGYVDVQRAVQEVEEGKNARERLKGELEERRKQIDSKKAELQKLQADYEKQAAVLSEDAKRKKQDELQRTFQAAQQSASEAQEDLARKEQEAMSTISSRMLQVVAQVSQAEGLTFVFDKAVLLFAPPSADITNEVVRKYNSQFGAGTAPKAEKKAEKPVGKK